jgi:hypothetical protein
MGRPPRDRPVADNRDGPGQQARPAWRAAAGRPSLAVTNGQLRTVTPKNQEGLPGVERVVDRVPGAVSAFCAFRAFGWAISAGSALWAGCSGYGKEKVYGSIP